MKIINNKGITLIELLVSLALVGVVVSIIFTFMLMNMRTFDREDVEIELQYQAQSTIDFITRKAKESKGILKIKKNNIEVQDSSSVELDRGDLIVFEYSNTENYNFRLKHNSDYDIDKIFYGESKDGSANTEIADYIHRIDLKSIPIGAYLKDGKGVEITLYFKKDKVEKIISSQVFYRNKEN